MSTTATITDALYDALVRRPTRLTGNEPEIQYILNLHAPDYKIAKDGAPWKLSGWQNCAAWLKQLEKMLRKTNCWNVWCGYEINEWAWVNLAPFGVQGYSTHDYNLLFLRSLLYTRRKQSLLKMIKQSIIPELHPAMQIDVNAALTDHRTIQKQIHKILFYSLEYTRLYDDPDAGSAPGEWDDIPVVLRRIFKTANVSEHRSNIYLPTGPNESVDQVCAMAQLVKKEFLTHTDLDDYIAISHNRMLERAANG